jgi:hypothetical protein
MNDTHPAAMSVVLVTPDDAKSIRTTLLHLKAQTVRDRLEVIIVAPSLNRLSLTASELEGFPHVRLVEAGEINSTGGAIAAGVREARAPLVGYAEEHSYLHPGWAEALIKAHSQPWAAVGAVIANANPATLTSWANLFTDFGPWVEPAEAGETRRLPWHHAVYKRAILLQYGPKLQTMLEAEGILHNDLHDRGYRFYLESSARTDHVNVSLLSSYMSAEFHGGRVFGASRARSGHWSVLRRLIYIGGMPIVPFMRLRGVLRDIRRSGCQRELLPRVLLPLTMGLVAHAVGELTGYALGAGAAVQRRVSFELSRRRHVTHQDRRASTACSVEWVKRGQCE